MKQLHCHNSMQTYQVARHAVATKGIKGVWWQLTSVFWLDAELDAEAGDRRSQLDQLAASYIQRLPESLRPKDMGDAAPGTMVKPDDPAQSLKRYVLQVYNSVLCVAWSGVRAFWLILLGRAATCCVLDL